MRVLWLIPLLFMFGCGAQTTGKNISPEIDITIRDCGVVNFDSGLATKSGDQDITSEQPTTFDTNLDLAIDWLEAAGMTKAANKLKSISAGQPTNPDASTQ